jgi:hypothetical protein
VGEGKWQQQYGVGRTVMIVRHATADDWPEVKRMGKAFFEATAFGAVGFDEESARSRRDSVDS